MTHRQVAEKVFEAIGKPPRIRSIPAGLIPIVASAFRPFNSNAFALIKFFEFLARTHDLTGEPIGRRKLQGFLSNRARGMSDAEADDAL